MIPIGMFVDREFEQGFLNERYNSDRAELIIIYGRRRVGKTRLLQEFVRDKKHLYLMADVSENVLDSFSRVISKKYGFVRFENWDDFFEFLHSIARERVVVVIDEFQYLYRVDKAFPTILQRWWETLKNSKIMLILCGSIISTIYKISLGYGSALYGRKTAELEVKPLKFVEIKNFFPRYSPKELVEVYAVLGGVPRYLEEFDYLADIASNIKSKILNRTSFLYNEPLNLLFEEFKDYSRYFGILNAIAGGATTFSEISSKSKVPQNKLSKYLMTLERIGIVKRIYPVTERKAKRTVYKLSDNFYRFWFRYVYPNRSFLEMDEVDPVLEEIRGDFNAFVGLAFEDIVIEMLSKKYKAGRWWYKDVEIDVVGIRKDEVVFFEVKWRDLSYKEALKILDKLEEKSELVKIDGKRKYGIVARKIREKEKLEGYFVYDLDDLIKS
ncbi:MAG: ATP-binding protein [Candidatus Neomarinimicrobiota bacterium]|nr:MAG: ATP-binding protein [Candidatus Neomarinimicrobiota bacterium]